MYDISRYAKLEEHRNKKIASANQYYKDKNKIDHIIQKNNKSHDSGMDYLCLSCLRLHNRSNVSKFKRNKNAEIDSKILLIEKSRNWDQNEYICKTCRPALYKRLPKLNFQRLEDIDNIGSIPNRLPELNLMEKYLLKLTIPFIRVSHVPRSPNLKLVGSSICIEADIEHSIERLKINSENIIPVSFKRKLAYRGHYLEQVVNKQKIFDWLAFLMKNNALYRNIRFNQTDIIDEIDIMSNDLLDELVTYDDHRLMKEQLEEKREDKANETEEDIMKEEDMSDSEDDEENSSVDALTEELDQREVPVHDTFLYHVNELNLEENTVTNSIAKYIYAKEKSNSKLMADLKDEFYPDHENFLFKETTGEEEDYESNEEATQSKPKVCSKNEKKEEDDWSNEEATITTDAEMKQSSKKGEEVNKGKLDIDAFFKQYDKKPRQKWKNVKKEKNKENETNKEREKTTVVAPGENKKIASVFEEEKCFPTLFHRGTGGYASSYLETGLGFTNYVKLRLTGGICVTDTDMHEKIKQIEKDSSVDYERFRRDHHYLMFLLLILDNIHMRRAQNTAFRKAKRFKNQTKVSEEDRELLERRNMGYRTFKNIRGTAPYFEHAKSRLFAFLRQKGPPTIFTTITSAEYDWIDLMENIIKTKPDARRIEDLIRTLKNKDLLSHLLNLNNKEKLRDHAKEIIQKMQGPEMSKLVNDHLVHTTKDFDSRVKYLFKLFKLPGFFDKGENYKIAEFFIRIEHQQRGAPHAHILLWMVYQDSYIEKTVFINGKKTVVNENRPAPNFKNSVEGKRGTDREEGIKTLENFANELITLEIKDDEDDVLKYQTHKHTFTCTKKKKNSFFLVKEDEGFGKYDGTMKGIALKTPKCRFHFPRFPIRATTFLEPLVEKDNNENVIQKADVNLNRIRKYMLRNLFQEVAGEAGSLRIQFLRLSFDDFLKNLGISELEYELALRRSVRGKGFMFLRRECSQVFINNFNKSLMNQHSANQDFTLCIDENQVAAYIVNYLTKNEAGQSKMLREVDEQCAKEGISYSEKLKKFAQALDQSREVSIQVCTKHRYIYQMLKCSNVLGNSVPSPVPTDDTV